jgi:hypothetical protein
VIFVDVAVPIVIYGCGVTGSHEADTHRASLYSFCLNFVLLIVGASSAPVRHRVFVEKERLM